MLVSSWYREMVAVTRIAVAAAALGAGLLLAPVEARAAENGAQPAVSPAKRVSPYARYAQEHAKSAQVKPARVRPSSSSAAKSRKRGSHRH